MLTMTPPVSPDSKSAFLKYGSKLLLLCQPNGQRPWQGRTRSEAKNETTGAMENKWYSVKLKRSRSNHKLRLYIVSE